MDYFVQCGTTAILNRNLPALADELRGELQHTGYVHEPHVISNLLTRRLTLTARIEAGTPQTAITVAETALLRHLRGHGAEYGWSASSTPTPRRRSVSCGGRPC